MIILNSFVTPLSVRRETLQKKFPFSSPFFMFWGVCTFSSNCCFVSCVVFCIVVLHIVTCVLPPVYLELWNFSEEFVDVSQSASSGILQYSGNLSFSWLNGILKRYYNIVGNISSSPRRLVFEKPAVTIEHRLLQFLHIANLTGRGNLIFNKHRKTKKS